MFGFGRKKHKQTAVPGSSEGRESGLPGSPEDGERSDAKGGLLKRLFGGREGGDADLGWVPGIGPLPEVAPAEPSALAPGAPSVSQLTDVTPQGEPEPPAAVEAPVTPPGSVEAPQAVADSHGRVPVPTPLHATPPAVALAPEATPTPESGDAPEAKKGILKRIFHWSDEPGAEAPAESETAAPALVAAPPSAPAPAARVIEVRDVPVDWESPEVRRGLFKRLRERLSRSRTTLGSGLGNLFLGRKKIDDELMEELETLLLTADVGVDATNRIIADLALRVKRKSLADPQALLAALKGELREILVAAHAPVRAAAPDRPQVLLMVGVNGAGKTTTIGKLARVLQMEGNSVMLAAGDTFRAAAVEQLETWGERNGVPVIAQHSGADSASVIFDALQAATARRVDVLIADTAGRLHTKTNLMDELSKIARVLRKIDPDAPHEVMLVVDATTGQNALNQAVQFHQTVGLTGITLTKLDGTAKGGIVFAIAERLKVPIRFIGVGEAIEDLRPFDADEFLDALLG